MSLPAITTLLKNQSNDQIMPHTANILRIFLLQMQNIAEEISFKKDDLLNQESTIQLLLEYVDINLFETDNDIQLTIVEILEFIWTLVDNTILVPQLLNANCVSFTLKWINTSELSLVIQRATIRLLYNIARHEKGCDALNGADAIRLLKEFKQRTLDPTIDDAAYEDMRLLFSMTLALLMEPKENESNAKSLRKVLDQLMQLTVNAARKKNHKYGDFYISEPLVVFTKLFVHDDIVHYCIKESQVKNMKISSKVAFFCDLMMQFRGALVNDDELDQLTLTALMNIIWSISFHHDYVDELKSNAKFLITIKSLANDDGEAWIEQYVPKHMSSVKKAAARILWNLDESSPENRFDIWVDFDYCHTEDLWEEIGQAIEKSDVILLLMTKDYQDSKSCRQEVMYTKDSLKKRFIPVYVKRDFVASGWLGVRIVGPQYIRFGKKSFEATVNDLMKLIFEDKSEKSSKHKDSKVSVTVPYVEIKPDENDKSNEELPRYDHENFNQSSNEIMPVLVSNPKLIEKWNSNDIANWFDANKVRCELKEMYDFQCGTELLLYGQCLRSDWQSECLDVQEQFSKRYNTVLYRNEFVRLNLLSVMTFNIRLDGVERDPNNHFTKRIYRLTETIEKWQPSILCVQEPFGGQLLHWQSHLPNYYRHIGYQPGGVDRDLKDPSSQRDFQVAILYNNRILKLIEQDYIWLSKTPRIVGSKDWNSAGERTLNIARFQLKNEKSISILVFNTHLDVKSEQARQEQAKIVRSTIKKWQKKYPTAVVLLFGDFNAVPKQAAYNILTSSDFLHDTWVVCKSQTSMCISNSFSSTFHGWLGSIINTYGFQFLQTILFTFHGSGISLPHEIPKHLSSYINILKELWKFRQILNISELNSLWSLHRFHVDWILYRNSIDGSEHLQPRFIAVVDIRSRNYSSDHFPVVALFQLKNNKEN
ncbi:unnamed protein product [Rotaria sordida]|uniref:TIR domain-containing protein n=1 Tax=Rotaria sordida TaxID=392033 RepID=A0A813XD42_9BILA|nr:unnamed protein product [Rotaria sordida]